MTLIGVAYHNPKKLAQEVNAMFPGTQQSTPDDGSGDFAGAPGGSDFVKGWWKQDDEEGA